MLDPGHPTARPRHRTNLPSSANPPREGRGTFSHCRIGLSEGKEGRATRADRVPIARGPPCPRDEPRRPHPLPGIVRHPARRVLDDLDRRTVPLSGIAPTRLAPVQDRSPATTVLTTPTTAYQHARTLPSLPRGVPSQGTSQSPPPSRRAGQCRGYEGGCAGGRGPLRREVRLASPARAATPRTRG
jgi:hypothetical protein